MFCVTDRKEDEIMIKDLTEGNPSKVLINFSLPMFVSAVFQQLYNMADSIIAGRFAGEDALAAVGASYPVTMIFMAIAMGCNIGCSVVISQFFGAKDYDKVKTAVSTTIIASVVLSAVLTVVGLLTSTFIMKAINTPENIFADSKLYFDVYIGGFIFLFLYNVANGVFNSLGDSKTPLYFLIGSSLGNIVLDLIFVAVFHWDVAGVAWATFIAQGIACILAVISLIRRLRGLETKEKPVYFSSMMLGKVTVIAIPSILQQSFISIGNMFIQGCVNSFGSSVIAGYSAGVKLNTFALTCYTTIGNAMSNFTAQNIGAGKTDRVKKGLKAGILFNYAIIIPILIAFIVFGKQMIGLFLTTESTDAINCGVLFLKIISPFYFAVAAKILVDGLLRGSGAMVAFTTSTFIDLILRVILAYIFAGMLGSETGIWLSWPFGWTIATCVTLAFYFKGGWKKARVY